MARLLPPHPFADRRARLAKAIGDAVLVLPAAPERVRSRDTMHRYSPDRDLHYLTGLAEPESCAVFLGDGEGDLRFEIFVRDRDPEVELWDGPRRGPEAAREEVGAAAAHPIDRLGPVLDELLAGADRVHFRLGAHPEVEPHLIRALRRARTRRQRSGRGPVEVVDPGPLLDPMRLRKDAAELARLRRAAEITVEAFEGVLPRIAPGVGEWEVEGWLDGAFRSGGGSGPAYGTIVGGGANATVLHYIANRDRLRPRELVLVDAGAQFELYAADLTRTLPVEGEFGGAQAELYAIVEGARSRAVEAVRPGATLAEVHRAAHDTLRDGLVGLGLLETDEEPDAIKAWFPHRTSHWLGLDVHDVGDYESDGRSTVLEPGMVLTVEPGLYFGPAAMERGGQAAAPFEGIGIRIEDDLLVTPEGHENLTAGVPTDPGELAEWVGEGEAARRDDEV